MTTKMSLWELRQPPQLRTPPSNASTSTPCQQTLSLAPSTGSAESSDLCQYGRSKCLAPRTTKKNGTLHSLCALHRDRSLANQRRFDEKKRKEREVDADAQAKKEDERRLERRARNKNKNKNMASHRDARSLSRARPTTTLPSFKSFTASIGRRAITGVAPLSTRATIADAWLEPFQVANANALAADSAWRATAVEQFLQDQ